MLENKIQNWFKKEQRSLPWRVNYSAYEVWISEIMLQQTQVKTVLPYFKRWMETLPTVESVADADEELLLKLWEGLGYYSRVRNIQKAAKVMLSEFSGKVPNKHEDLLKLAGIGPYTAGAIMSIAHNKPYPIVDGNVIRLLSRLNNFHGVVNENKKSFWAWAEELVKKSKGDEGPRELNQGLMELGALICTPKNVKCDSCPLKNDCKAYANGTVNELPNKGKKKSPTPITVAIAAIQKDGKLFIQKRPAKGLMAGLWEFPGGKVEDGESVEEALHREIKEELGVQVRNLQSVSRIKHAYTSFKVDLHCFLVDYEQGELQLNAAQEGKWVELSEIQNYAFPAANVKFMKALIKLNFS